MEKLRKHEDNKPGVFRWLVLPRLPVFVEKANSSRNYNVRIPRLSNFFPRSMHDYSLSALNDRWILEEVEEIKGDALPTPSSMELLWECERMPNLPVGQFRPTAIGSSKCDVFPHEVKDKAGTYGFRPVATTSTERLTDDELEACKKTGRPEFPSYIRIVRPHAFVVEGSKSPWAFLGIIYGPVPRQTNRTLLFMVRNASQKDKEKWAKQLEMTVKGLVEEDIVWKNASPENIFIDDNGHIVVDWLRLRRDPGRWVSEKNQDTMAGNTESLVKIIRFIDPSLLPEVDPRPRAGELSSHSN